MSIGPHSLLNYIDGQITHFPGKDHKFTCASTCCAHIHVSVGAHKYVHIFRLYFYNTKPNWYFCVHLANQVDVKLTFLFRIGHSNHHLHHRIFAFLAVTMWQNKYEIGFSTVVIIACPNTASTFGMCQFWRYNCRHCATCAVCPWARSVCIITWICYHPYQCAQRLRVRQHCFSLKS